MCNPEHEAYLGEIFVRREISRVFDVCLSCRRCVDACGVFPSLVETVERGSLVDAGMLTPLQQDEILDSCHLCMQCVVQCPYGGLAPRPDVVPVESLGSVNFPQLVIRQRAMQWAQGDIGIRQKCVALFLSYSVRLAHAMRFMRSIVGTLMRRTPNGDVVIFPTCVAEQHRPEIVDDFTTVCSAIDVRAVGNDSFVCCGAPDLYSGNFSRFRRIARRNSALISRLVSRGKTVVVGQSRCVSVMKEMYPSVARHKHVGNISVNLVGLTEYLGQQLSSQPRAQRPQCEAGTRVVILESSAQQLSAALTASSSGATATGNAIVGVRQMLEVCGADVADVQYSSFVDTTWSAQHQFDDVSANEAQTLARAIDDVWASDPHRVVIGESCLTNAFLEETSGHRVIHPVSFLAQQISKK